MNIEKLCDKLPQWMRRQKLIQVLLMFSPASAEQRVKLGNGASLYADISDPFPRTYFLTRSYDPEFLRVAKPFLSKGGVFFDVGANFGFCSFGLLPELDPEKVAFHLFEANERLCGFLKRSMMLHPEMNAKLNHVCVTNIPGTSKFHIQNGQLGESHVSAQGDETVPNLTLDDYIKKQGIEKIDFVKMDIEGSEPDALEGASQSLRAGKIKAIYLEISAVTLNRIQKSHEDCFKKLHEAGYSLFYIKDIDFEKGHACQEKMIALNVNDTSLKVSELKHYPENHDTDILAIHKSVLEIAHAH